MDTLPLPINEEADAAVNEYSNAIIEFVKAMEPDMELDVHKDYVANDTLTVKASTIDISSEFAFITVFPDFKKNAAVASLLNRGMIRAMEIEGFDDDTINNAPVYCATKPYKTEHAEMFALLLTHDFNLQHQKLLD